jgi:hypothetical protein
MTNDAKIWAGFLVVLVIGVLTYGWIDKNQRRDAQRRLAQMDKEACEKAMAEIGAVYLNLNMSYGYLVNTFGEHRVMRGKGFTTNSVTVSWWHDTVWAEFVTEEPEPSYAAQPIRLHVRVPFKGSLQGVSIGDSPESLPPTLRLSWDKEMQFERSHSARTGKSVDPSRERRLTISGDPICIEYAVKDDKILSIKAWDKRWWKLPVGKKKGASKF